MIYYNFYVLYKKMRIFLRGNVDMLKDFSWDYMLSFNRELRFVAIAVGYKSSQSYDKIIVYLIQSAKAFWALRLFRGTAIVITP